MDWNIKNKTQWTLIVYLLQTGIIRRFKKFIYFFYVLGKIGVKLSKKEKKQNKKLKDC